MSVQLSDDVMCASVCALLLQFHVLQCSRAPLTQITQHIITHLFYHSVINALLGQKFLAEGILPTTNEISILK